MGKLGGFRSVDYPVEPRGKPKCPKDDVEQEYRWESVFWYNAFAHIVYSLGDIYDLQTDGYEMRSWEFVDDTLNIFYFAKLKESTATVAEVGAS